MSPVMYLDMTLKVLQLCGVALVAAALQSLCDLDNAGGAQAGRAQHNELLRVGKAGNAAGGLDLHMGRDMGGEQLHVVERCAGGREAGGCLDKVLWQFLRILESISLKKASSVS